MSSWAAELRMGPSLRKRRRTGRRSLQPQHMEPQKAQPSLKDQRATSAGLLPSHKATSPQGHPDLLDLLNVQEMQNSEDEETKKGDVASTKALEEVEEVEPKSTPETTSDLDNISDTPKTENIVLKRRAMSI